MDIPLLGAVTNRLRFDEGRREDQVDAVATVQEITMIGQYENAALK